MDRFFKKRRIKFTTGFTRLVDFGFVFEIIKNNFYRLFHKVDKSMILGFLKSKTVKISKPKFTTGFTLVEALVAISLLMVSISSPMFIAQRGLSASMFSRDQMTASFLAQDGIEAVKNIRDYVAINQNVEKTRYTDWLFFLDKCICDSDESCNFDNSNTASIKYCNLDTTSLSLVGDGVIKGNTDVNNPLKINRDSSDNFIKFDLFAIQESKFSRMINIRKTANRDEALVQVRVFWNQGTEQQKVDLKTFIYNYATYNFE